MFKGEARYQFERDLQKMKKKGWRIQTLTDEGKGSGAAHTGKLTVVYEK